MSERTQGMRKNLPIKCLVATTRGLEKETEQRVTYQPGVKLCLERARLLTESYKATEGGPLVLRRAKALDNILSNMTIYIGEEELIVGNYASRPEYITCWPELAFRWIEKALNNGLRSMADDEGRREAKEIAGYWQNKSAQGQERAYLPEDLKPYWAYNGATMLWVGAESGVPNYHKLFRIGLNGVIEEIENRLRNLSDAAISPLDYVSQKDFLQAALISLRAAVNFGKRFAVRAREMAQQEANVERKRELEEIAEICDWVPGNPPRTFHEALQFFWFIHLIVHMIEMWTNGCAVRFDLLMYPFYKEDKEKGRITREKAQELVEMLWLKFEQNTPMMPPVTMAGVGAGNLWQNVTIGGMTPEGADATNEVSYIVLDASKAMHTLQPSLTLRYHDKIAKELVFSAIDLLRTGTGYPAIFNDKYEIPMLIGLGIPAEDARNYGIEACMRWTIPGKNIACRALNGMVVLPKCLELAFNQGIDKFSGKQLGVKTPDPITFTSIEDVMKAFLEQARFFVDKLVRINHLIDAMYARWLPRPFLSALMDGCIEKGKDCREWSYFYKTILGPSGTSTVADSMAAMKKLVFEEKRVLMAELLDALSNNWEGKEDLRQTFLNDAPNFGNDDDYVDILAREIHYEFAKIVESHTNYLGFPWLVDGSSGAAYYGYSALTGATPDGRKDREPFNDGTISPGPGRDRKGPTAVLRSVSKVDPLITYNQLFNQKFLPQYLEGENKEMFAAYLKTWADLGIHHVQFNVVDRATLLQAQEHPQEHKGLIVRVAGFSAYFVDLPRGLQDAIIARTEQRL